MLICDEYISEQLKYTDVFSLFLILQLPITWTIIVYVQLKVNLTLQEWGKVPTANAYADGQMSVPSA
jgi:hypothetical protein